MSKGGRLYPATAVLLAFRPVHAGNAARSLVVLVVVGLVAIGSSGWVPPFGEPWENFVPDWQPAKTVVYFLLYFLLALMSGVVFLPLFLIIRALMSWENRARQRSRDRRAGLIVERVLDRPEGKPPRFSLYLRPFTTADRLGTAEVGAVVQFEGRMGVVNIQTDFEALLAVALPASRPLIAAGRPDVLLTAATDQQDGEWAPDIPGIGKFPCTEADWRSRVTAAARAAELIVVIPLDFPGTRWELQWLKENGFLAKCVFLMPATRQGSPDYTKPWRSARAALSATGVTLPDYSPEGALFAFADADLSVPVSFPLATIAPTTLLLSHHFYRLRRTIRQNGSKPERKPDAATR
ncbi:hypothetical protein [Amycolatopsis sp. NPDC021455]|uniref:hypothetical protein n=1 Tax=Amycolatopsis sp. NPDC021455 TaxID=3154901 RepID=UPI0033F65C5F